MMFHTEYHWKTFQVFMQRPQTIGIGKGNHHFRTEATKVKSPLESPSPLPPPLSLILLAVLYLSTHCIWSRGVFPILSLSLSSRCARRNTCLVSAALEFSVFGLSKLNPTGRTFSRIFQALWDGLLLDLWHFNTILLLKGALHPNYFECMRRLVHVFQQLLDMCSVF